MQKTLKRLEDKIVSKVRCSAAQQCLARPLLAVLQTFVNQWLLALKR